MHRLPHETWCRTRLTVRDNDAAGLRSIVGTGVESPHGHPAPIVRRMRPWSFDIPITERTPRLGFSLLELLIVVAIVALLAVGTIPALRSILQARGASNAAYQVAAAVELARSEAIARRTFVWLALQTQTNSGNTDLRLGLFYSKDGTTNHSSTNVAPLARPLLLERSDMVSFSSATSFVTNNPAPEDLSGAASGATFTSGNVTFSSGRTITFTPLGEASTTATPAWSNTFSPRIAIALQQTTGTTRQTNDTLAVLVDGSVGLPTIYRR